MSVLERLTYVGPGMQMEKQPDSESGVCGFDSHFGHCVCNVATLTRSWVKRRVVNSFMVASMPFGAAELVSQAEQDEFITTTIVRRRGYDRQHLTDDQ